MTKKKAKQNVEDAAIISDLTTQLEATIKARDEKLAGSMEHLRAQLDMASDKYRTVNGFMQALSTMNQVVFGDSELMVGARPAARELAIQMSAIAYDLVLKLKDADVMTIDEKFLDGLLEENFVGEGVTTTEGITKQLLIVNLLQNVGPAIDDIVQFRAGANDAIEKIRAELDKYNKETKPDLKVVN